MMGGTPLNGRPCLVPLPLAAAMGILLFVGQLPALRFYFPPPPGDTAAILVSFAVQAFFWTVLMSALGAILMRWLPARAAGWIWGCLAAASTTPYWNTVGYGWLGLHLPDALPMLWWSFLTDFKIMKARSGALAIAVSALALAGYVLGRSVDRWQARSGADMLAVAPRRLGAWLLAAGLALGIEPFLFARYATPRAVENRRSVSWHPLFEFRRGTDPLAARLAVDHPRFRMPPSGSGLKGGGPGTGLMPETNAPHVFIVICESLRADALSSGLMPRLAARQSRAIPVERAFAAANCTHMAWLSIAHSTPPHLWNFIAQRSPRHGAAPVRLLHDAGYTIHFLASLSAAYFGTAESILGDGRHLASEYVDQGILLADGIDPSPPSLDLENMRRVQAGLDRFVPGSRHCYMVMLNSTHYEYRWPPTEPARHQPILDGPVLLASSVKEDRIEWLRNRYRNSVEFTDRILGEFFDSLEARGLLDSSVVVVTGDHGEEFLERGHLIHGSELNAYQLQVPLLVHLPKSIPIPARVSIASHVDIMPTILDAVGLWGQTRDQWDGTSLLRGGSGFALVAQCASFSPRQLAMFGPGGGVGIQIHNATKWRGRLHATRIFASRLFDEAGSPLDSDATPGPGQLDEAGRLFDQFRQRYLEP